MLLFVVLFIGLYLNLMFLMLNGHCHMLKLLCIHMFLMVHFKCEERGILKVGKVRSVSKNTME